MSPRALCAAALYLYCRCLVNVKGAGRRCYLRWESLKVFLLELDKAGTGSSVIPVLMEHYPDLTPDLSGS